MLKLPVNNRKRLENWSDADIKQYDDEVFDFLVLANSHGFRVFNKEYTEIDYLDKEELDRLEIGEHYYDKL